MTATAKDSLNTRSTLTVGSKTYSYFSLPKAAETLGDISRLPFSMKVLLENLLRFEDGETVTGRDLEAMAEWLKERRISREIQYRPARVLMQDFTGVPAVVDLAAMRDAMTSLGGDPQKINPLVPVHLVIDHSVMVDEFGLDEMDTRVLRSLIEQFSGGPVGLQTLAVAIGEDAGTLEEVYEPFLIQNGFLMRTPRGRVATPLAYRRFGYAPPMEGGPADGGAGQPTLFDR